MSNWNISKPSFQAKRRMQLPNSLTFEYSTRTLWRHGRGNLDNHKRLWQLILKKFSIFPLSVCTIQKTLSVSLPVYPVLFAVLKLLGYEYHLKSTSVSNQVISLLPPNKKGSWYLRSVKECWRHPKVLDSMTGSATELRHMNLCVSVRISHDLRRLWRLISINHFDNSAAASKLKNHIMLRASRVRVNTHSGVVLCNIENVALADPLEKKWYELGSYGTFKQADPPSATDKRAQKTLDSTTLHDGSRYVVGMLWVEYNIHLSDDFNALFVQFKSLEKRLEKRLNLKTLYASDIRGDVKKGYIIPVSPHDKKRFLNGVSKFHGKSLNKSLLVGPICFRTCYLY